MRVIGSFALVCSLFVCPGCGGGPDDAPDLVAATGTVFYKGKPISGASVTFIIEGSPIASGTTDSEGKFSMTTGGRPGAPLGNAKVAIAKAGEQPEGMSETMTPQDMADMAAKGQMKMSGAEPEIPLKYSNPDKSNLLATLDADGSKNVFEYRLED